jgi:hypothetical protein
MAVTAAALARRRAPCRAVSDLAAAREQGGADQLSVSVECVSCVCQLSVSVESGSRARAVGATAVARAAEAKPEMGREA